MAPDRHLRLVDPAHDPAALLAALDHARATGVRRRGRAALGAADAGAAAVLKPQPSSSQASISCRAMAVRSGMSKSSGSAFRTSARVTQRAGKTLTGSIRSDGPPALEEAEADYGDLPVISAATTPMIVVPPMTPATVSWP